MNHSQTLFCSQRAQYAMAFRLAELACCIHEEELKAQPNSPDIMAWEREQRRLQQACRAWQEAAQNACRV